MARPYPKDTYMVNIDETETFFPAEREEGIADRLPGADAKNAPL